MKDSLQDKKYIGGLYGAQGYEFEKSYILSQLPEWLAVPDFESLQQELWSDLELFFTSGKRWLIQIKNHSLELGELREILRDFQTRHDSSQGQYERYVIVSTGASNHVREIGNLIERWTAITHLSEPELESTRYQATAKSAELGFSELAEFLLTNAKLLHLITDAGWVKNETIVRKVFSSTLSANYKIKLDDAEQSYLRMAQRLATERGKLITAFALREEIRSASLRETESSSAAVPFVLPQLDTLTFTGRDEELRKLEGLILTEAQSRVCSIVGVAGTGGIGKSALACHFAELHREAFPDGIVGLRVDGKNNDAIAREFARVSGEEIAPEDERDAATIMQERFRHRRMLLIFDNAEDAAIQFLRPGGDKCAVIITTRDRQLPTLLGVPQAGQIDLSPLLHLEAVAFLAQLIGADRLEAEQAAADEIISLVGSLPLALQIIGASLQMQIGRSLANCAESLKEERTRLEKLKLRGAAHLDVRASFSLSLRLLEDPMIDFFASLSVCARDGFSLHTAMAAGQCEEFNAHEWLGHLYRMSLLNRPQLGTNRFVFHPLIRVFANEIASERGLEEPSAERHARFFVSLVKSADPNDEETSSLLATELDDIVLATEWLQRQQIPDYGFVIRLEPFLQQNGHWKQATDLMAGFLLLAEQKEDWASVVQLRIQEAKFLSLSGAWGEAESALNVVPALIDRIEVPELRQRSEAMFLTANGGVLQRVGRYEDAANAFARSSVILEELRDLRGQALVLNSLGGILQRQGHFEEAVVALRRSAAIDQQLNNKRGQAMALTSLGGVLQRQGKFDEAVAAFEQSAEIEEGIGNQRGQAMVLNSLAGVFQRQGKFHEAVRALQRSAEIEDRLGDQRGRAMILTSLGGVYQRQGKFDEAVEAFQLSAEIEDRLGNQRGQAMVLNSLGGVFQRQGRFHEAVEAFQLSAEIENRLGNQRGQAMVLNSLGGVFQRQGKFDEAVDAFQRSYEISDRLNDDRSLAMVLNSLGGALQRQGKFDEAVDAFQRSYEISHRLNDDRSLAMVLNSLGGVFQRQGKFDEAVDAFQRSYEISHRLNDDRSLAMVLNSLGGVFQRQGKFDKAVDAFGKSVGIGERLGDKRHLAMALNSLGGVFQRQGRFDKAVDCFQRSYDLLVQRGDQRGQAMVLNSLGVLHHRMGNIDKAVEAFESSVKIGKGLNDLRHLAIAHTAFGRTLLNGGNPERGANELGEAFVFEESIKSRRGVELVMPLLATALAQIGRPDELSDYLRRALSVAPNSRVLLRLQDSASSADLLEGSIVQVIRHTDGHRFGFIAPDERKEFTKQIYFHERGVVPESLPVIAVGVRVTFKVVSGRKGPQATRIRVIDSRHRISQPG